MIYMKRILSVLLTIALLLSIAPTGLFSVTASAATSYTDGYYTYTITNSKAKITDVDTAISGVETLTEILRSVDRGTEQYIMDYLKKEN